MALDDPRIEWIRDRVYGAFSLSDPECFEELLGRNDGEQEAKLLRFLNETSTEEGSSAMLFFKTLKEDEVEVEIALEPEELLKHSQVPSDGDINDTTISQEAKEQKESVDSASLVSSDAIVERELTSAPDTQAAVSEIDEKAIAKEESSILPEPGIESFQEESPEEFAPVPMTKIFKKKLYRTVLYVSCNCIPEEFVDSSALYFLRNTQETIPEPNDLQEANDVLPMFLEYGMLNGNSLLMLKQIFSQVFMPLLSYNHHKNESGSLELEQAQQSVTNTEKHCPEASKNAEAGHEFRSIQMIRDEFLMNMQKFLNHVQQTIQQLEGK